MAIRASECHRRVLANGSRRFLLNYGDFRIHSRHFFLLCKNSSSSRFGVKSGAKLIRPADFLAAYESTRTATGELSRTSTTAPGPRRTSLPRVVSTAAVPAPPAAVAPIAAPFLPPLMPPTTAPPVAGMAIVAASFFFVPGATRVHVCVLIRYLSSSRRDVSV